MSRFRLRAALLIGLCGIVLLLMPLASGNASDLPTAVTNVKIDQTTAGQFSAVTVDIAFALPADSKAGDTFSVGLPASLILQQATFALRAPDGLQVATGVVHNGVVTFTLTNYVATHHNVLGGAKLDAHFNQSVIKPGQTNVFTFTSGSTQWHSPVGIVVPVATSHAGPHKFGYWTDLNDQGVTKPKDALHWIVQSWAGPLTDLVFRDTVGPGQAIDCGTLHVVSSTTFDALGNLTNAKPLGTRAVVACTEPTGFKVSVASVLAKEVVEVSYDTSITDETQNPFTNSLLVTATGKTQPIEASVKHYGAFGSASGALPPPTTTPPSTAPPTTATTAPPPPTTTAATTTPTTTAPTSSVEASTTVRTTTAASSVEASTTVRTTTAASSVEASTTSRTTAFAVVTTPASALPFTGSRTSVLTEAAGGLLLLGSGLMLVGRRRGRHVA